MNVLENKIPPLLIAVLVAIGMWFIPTVTAAKPSGLLRGGLAAIVALSGIAVVIAGVISFRKAKTTVNPLRPETVTSLVIVGIYHITRNPMYTGMALVLAGFGVFLWSPALLLGPSLFVIYITFFQIVPEERVLARKFGDEYLRYKNTVRRWL
jgi:protein-S-isoprenylcysteine O-methyltransferase Ste14